MTLGVVIDFHVAVQRKRQAEKCVGYALSCCSMQLPAPLPSDSLRPEFVIIVSIVSGM